MCALQDAAWEVDDSTAFEDLLERHGHCDAEECLCPDGRTEDVDYTPWEVVSLIFLRYMFSIYMMYAAACSTGGC